MTDRHAGYIVTLKREIREDDAEVLINAIRLLEPVASVEPIPADWDHHVAVDRAKYELREELRDVLWPKTARGCKSAAKGTP